MPGSIDGMQFIIQNLEVFKKIKNLEFLKNIMFYYQIILTRTVLFTYLTM
jgi:hypothetical protein